LKITVSLFALGALAVALPAEAELVYLTTGRTMSVKAHRTEGELVVLALRGGGEMTLDRSLIERFAPDEVPYPDPEAESQVVATVVSEPPPAAPVSALPQPPAQYASIIERASAVHGVDARLVQAVIQVESNYQQRARSPKGAMGLMQLMPATARQYGVRNPYDAESNIEAGVRHLKSLLERFPLALALAAYNAGEATVRRFSGVPPYPETRNYVSKILNLVGTR
jgi:soluble lytic murein transglycosylase-like protein